MFFLFSYLDLIFHTLIDIQINTISLFFANFVLGFDITFCVINKQSRRHLIVISLYCENKKRGGIDMNLKFLHRPKPRQFNYKPLYYDEHKEELEKLKRRYSDDEKNDYSNRIHEGFRRKRANSFGVVSPTKILLTIFVVVMALYIIFHIVDKVVIKLLGF